MDVYAETILDHYRHPRNKNPLPPGKGGARSAPGEGIVTHEEVNLSCGDSITLSLILKDGTIASLGWDGTGCAISQAAMSMLSEELAGMSVEDALALSPDSIHELLSVPIGPRRTKCALLCLHTLKNALRKSKGEASQGWTETVQ